ncbi:hypothetical protein ECG_01198 [Echinococcus granulosus]|nr:hypothetical protein ECG_01198 [Echinococcus granulosus]
MLSNTCVTFEFHVIAYWCFTQSHVALCHTICWQERLWVLKAIQNLKLAFTCMILQRRKDLISRAAKHF